MEPTDFIKPVPDPTALTSKALEEAILHLRELVEARFNAMDSAVRLLRQDSDKLPLQIESKIQALQELHQEKFLSIQTQFRERDTRTEQTSKDSKVAVDAALQAAKEAVGEQNKSSALAIAKSESATIKQIDQQGLLIANSNKALDDKIDDIKERLTRIEGVGSGLGQAHSLTSSSNSFFVALVGMIIGVCVGVAGLLITLFNHKP